MTADARLWAFLAPSSSPHSFFTVSWSSSHLSSLFAMSLPSLSPSHMLSLSPVQVHVLKRPKRVTSGKKNCGRGKRERRGGRN